MCVVVCGAFNYLQLCFAFQCLSDMLITANKFSSSSVVYCELRICRCSAVFIRVLVLQSLLRFDSILKKINDDDVANDNDNDNDDDDDDYVCLSAG